MILCLKKAARRQKFCKSAAKIGHMYFIFKQPHKSGCFLYAPVNGPLYPAYIKQVFDSYKRPASHRKKLKPQVIKIPGTEKLSREIYNHIYWFYVHQTNHADAFAAFKMLSMQSCFASSSVSIGSFVSFA